MTEQEIYAKRRLLMFLIAYLSVLFIAVTAMIISVIALTDQAQDQCTWEDCSEVTNGSIGKVCVYQGDAACLVVPD